VDELPLHLPCIGPKFASDTLSRKPGTVETFRYEAAIRTMDGKYPFPDWLKNRVTVEENILQLDTSSGLILVKPGQWIVKDNSDNLHVLEPEDFHQSYDLSD
jgi:hypothetical protein